jgi:hypothetical protein
MKKLALNPRFKSKLLKNGQESIMISEDSAEFFKE